MEYKVISKCHPDCDGLVNITLPKGVTDMPAGSEILLPMLTLESLGACICPLIDFPLA